MNPRTKKLMQKLGELSREIDNPLDKEEEKQKVKQQIEKIKQIHPQNQEALKKEIEKLEDYILDSIFLEEQILEKENKDFSSIQNQIKQIKEISQPDKIKSRLGKLEHLMGEVASRVNSYIDIETQREQRLKEVQEKIQENMHSHLKEIKNLEDKMTSLENKLEKLRESEEFDEEHLSIIEDKIESLRSKLRQKQIETIERKKQEFIEKKKTEQEKPKEIAPKEELPELLPPPKKELPPALTEKKLSPPPKHQQKIQHRMLFKPEKELEEELKKEAMPEEKSKLEDIGMPKPPKPKKRFFSKIVNKIKNIFKKKPSKKLPPLE